jgi:sugar lactone lactonase YvrE
VYDAGTGADIAVYSLATGTTFINDVIVTPDAAWFTDSFNPALYKVPIGADGSLGAVTPLPLTGAFAALFVSGPGVFNANGIAATSDGTRLIIVQSNTGKLFTVSPLTGATLEITLGTENVANGDGILLQGQSLYVVQNQTKQLAVITLSADFTTGAITQRVTNPSFDVPTTVAASNGSLYLVNARFGSVENPDTAEYSVVRINKPSPDVIALPTGFRPEGVAISGTSLFVGSIPSGRVFKADITTGQGQVFISPAAGRSSIGMKVDGRGRLFVAGGATGQAYVYDAGTGADIAVYSLATGTTFINDVTLAPDAAWFTDSRNPVLYKVPISSDGTLGAQATVTPLTLTGDFVFVAGQNNANGIAATPDGTTLIIVSVGKLFTVNPDTGVTKEILLGGENVTNGDGILLQGQTLFVVQNRLNQVAVIALSADLTTGTVTTRVTSPAFDVPTTVAASNGSLYLPNARFGIADPDLADYAVVRINKP